MKPLRKGRSSTYLESVFKTASEGILIVDTGGHILGSNPALDKLLGYKKGELEGKRFNEIVHQQAEGVRVASAVNIEPFKRPSKVPLEIELMSKKGVVRPVKLRSTLIKDDQGKVVEAVGIIEDLRGITEGRKIEKELNETKDFLEKVIDHTVDGILIADLSGHIIDVNSALENMTGLRKEALIGEHASLLISEDEETRKRFRKKASELFEKGNTSYESSLKRRGGKYIEVDVNTSLIKDEKGDYIAGVSIFRDISERKKAEREIRETKEFLENLFKTSNDAILVTDPKGEITMVNDAMESMVGYSRDELLGKYANMLSPPDKEVRSKVLKELERLFEEGSIHGYETVWQRKDSQCISIESNRSLLKDKDGNVIGGVSFVRDVTEKKKVESMLLQSEKLKSLGELAGGVAHDFNNVLAAILGRVQLLRIYFETSFGRKERRKGVLELKKGLEIIEKASLDGAETVRRIQEFSRRRTDDKKITQVDINDLIRNALEFTRVRWKNEAESGGIHIKIRKELSSLPPIAGSASELREVFTNLINNAIDAMPQGGEISIKTFKKNSHISVELEDTGCGIPKAIRDRIFDPFFTTKGPQSTGLGMSVSYGIIDRHGGTIKIKSVEGKGTSFAIQFPLSREIIEGGEENAKPIMGNPKKARILVVEDKEDVCEVLKDILVNGGHEVETVPDGSEGIKLFKKKNFNLVFTDLGMPRKSGWQVAKEVKKINKNTPVALITGWEVQLDRSKLRKSGVDLVVNKPFKVDQVLRLAQEGMELKRFPRSVKRK